MSKGLLKLKDDELNWLSDKISVINLQNGCPVQCIICGASAPKYSGKMSWSDYMLISDSILDVKATKNIDVLVRDVCAFSSSDPIYYHSFDGKIEKTIYDIVIDITSRHNKNTFITTSGWKSGNNFMEHAIEKIVDRYFNNSNFEFYYSVKTVSRNVMKEYDMFLQKFNNNTKLADQAFINESKYVANLINNSKILARLDESTDIYMFQCMSDDAVTNLNNQYKKYASLFSEKFSSKLFSHLKNIGVLTTMSSFRKFAGLGRLLDITNISPSVLLKENMRLVNSKKEIGEYGYNVDINSLGILEIYYGGCHSLSKILVPKEHFMILKEQSTSMADKQKYAMLANLQYKRLLD